MGLFIFLFFFFHHIFFFFQKKNFLAENRGFAILCNLSAVSKSNLFF